MVQAVPSQCWVSVWVLKLVSSTYWPTAQMSLALIAAAAWRMLPLVPWLGLATKLQPQTGGVPVGVAPSGAAPPLLGKRPVPPRLLDAATLPTATSAKARRPSASQIKRRITVAPSFGRRAQRTLSPSG